MSPRVSRSASLVAIGVLVAVGIGQAIWEQAARGGTVPERTPAQILTGSPLPPEPTASTWVTAWSIDAMWLIAAASAAALYVVGVRRVRADGWPVGRSAAWGAGLLLLVWATSGMPAVYGDVLLSVHVLAYALVAALVPALLAIGAPLTLARRALPPGGIRVGLARARRSPVFSVVSHPLFALTLPLAFGALYVGTDLIRWSLHIPLVGEIVEVVALATGWLFALSMCGPDPAPHRLRPLGRAGALLVAVTAHAAFGVWLMLAQGLVVAEWFGGLGREWGVPPLADQATAGWVALVVLLAADATLALGWAADRGGRRASSAARAGADELAGYDALLRGGHG